MNRPIHEDQINKVLLKPRFKMEFDKNKKEILNKFKDNLEDENCRYCSKIIDHHIVIDVPVEEEHFWSPQMHVEIENEENKTVVKGVLGPKPKVWTFFIFLHFAVAIAFFAFFVIFYTKWSLKQDYTFAMIMCIVMPILWVILYFVGQLGKKFGNKQMVELHDFLIKTLETNS